MQIGGSEQPMEMAFGGIVREGRWRAIRDVERPGGAQMVLDHDSGRTMSRQLT